MAEVFMKRNCLAVAVIWLAVAGAAEGAPGAASVAEWEWGFQRWVNVGAGEPPVRLTESVHVTIANRGESSVRVTFRAQAKDGLPAGSFRGRKEVSYTMARVYEKVVVRGGRFIARPRRGGFKLVESDPAGPGLAEFSTLGGIARGKNMVAVVDEAFGGEENLFSLDGERLSFVNQGVNGSNGRAFPKEIVLEAVK